MTSVIMVSIVDMMETKSELVEFCRPCGDGNVGSWFDVLAIDDRDVDGSAS